MTLPKASLRSGLDEEKQSNTRGIRPSKRNKALEATGRHSRVVPSCPVTVHVGAKASRRQGGSSPPHVAGELLLLPLQKNKVTRRWLRGTREGATSVGRRGTSPDAQMRRRRSRQGRRSWRGSRRWKTSTIWSI